jgi:putative intracellular protease/amidase
VLRSALRAAAPNGYRAQDSELQVPYDRVRDAGHEPVIVGLRAGKDVTGKNGASVTSSAASMRSAPVSSTRS